MLIKIRLTAWQQSMQTLVAIRETVFINEQHVPVDLEWDGLDDTAQHLLAWVDNTPVGCARILASGSIGRMAVLAAWRGKGVGQALLQKAIQICHQNHVRTVRLSAQTHAIPFYEKAGFIVCSDVYDDAGIPHRDMQLHLTQS